MMGCAATTTTPQDRVRCKRSRGPREGHKRERRCSPRHTHSCLRKRVRQRARREESEASSRASIPSRFNHPLQSNSEQRERPGRSLLLFCPVLHDAELVPWLATCTQPRAFANSPSLILRTAGASLRLQGSPRLTPHRFGARNAAHATTGSYVALTSYERRQKTSQKLSG